MIDYSKWKNLIASVTRLRLDPENPRLATSITRPTQAMLIADLLEHEEVADLARDISRQGFFPNEALVTYKDGSNLFVLEGNRRLAALKLLLNPDLAPEPYQKRIRQYSERVAPKINKVPIIIAPSRSAAVPLLIARHKGDPIKRWTTVMQARFLLGRQNDGLSVDEIAEETGLERAEVIRGLRDAKLYDVILSLELPIAIQKVVHDPRQFPFSTLQRFVDFSSVQSFLGMQTDPKHGFTTTLPADRFQALLGHIVKHVADGRITSRSHNTAKEVEEYIKEVEKELGKPTKAVGKRTPADEFVDPSRIQPKPRAKAPRTAKKQPAQVGLIPRSFRVDVDDGRIRDIVEELKALSLVKFPNASAITFRSLLDMAVTRYMNEIGELEPLIAQLSKKSPKSSDWIPSLKQQLCHIQQTSTIPLGPDGRKALTKFLSDTNKSLTLDALNWFTHVLYVPPTVEQMRAFWINLVPLFELTLQEP